MISNPYHTLEIPRGLYQIQITIWRCSECNFLKLPKSHSGRGWFSLNNTRNDNKHGRVIIEFNLLCFMWLTLELKDMKSLLNYAYYKFLFSKLRYIKPSTNISASPPVLSVRYFSDVSSFLAPTLWEPSKWQCLSLTVSLSLTEFLNSDFYNSISQPSFIRISWYLAHLSTLGCRWWY